MSRASQHPTERDRPGLHMALAALERRQNIYPGADSIPRLLLEQIGNQGAVQEQSYDALLAERDQLRAEVERLTKLAEAISADCNTVACERNDLRAELAEYQADPSYATACETIRKLRAELAAIRGQQVIGRVHHNEEHAEPVRAVLNSIGRQLPDNAPLYALQPQQPDAALTASPRIPERLIGAPDVEKMLISIGMNGCVNYCHAQDIWNACVDAAYRYPDEGE